MHAVRVRAKPHFVANASKAARGIATGAEAAASAEDGKEGSPYDAAKYLCARANSS